MNLENGRKKFRKYTLVLITDKYMLPGMVVTLFSLLISADSDNSYEINIVSDDIDEHFKTLLGELLLETDRNFYLYFISEEEFSRNRYRSKYYSISSFLKFDIPEYFDQDAVLYLDSDLIFENCDVASIFNKNLDRSYLAGVPYSNFGNSIDSTFFKLRKQESNKPYFNSGVLLFNVKFCRENNFSLRCYDLYTRYGEMLKTRDQSIMNSVCNGNIVELEKLYNKPIYSSGVPIKVDSIKSGIYHMVGRPKPWDPYGRYFNKQSPFFLKWWNRLSSSRNMKADLDVVSSVRLVLRLFKHYVKCIVK